MSAFEDCLAIVLREEGGYVNDKRDPGGMTNLGVTRRVWEAWLKRAVTEAEMRALTPSMVGALYRTNYWSPNYCDGMPKPFALCVFDMAVNAGVSRSAMLLQSMIGVAPDGIIGVKTRAQLSAWLAAQGTPTAVRKYQEARRGYYRTRKKFPIFGHGWLNRVDTVETAALRMLP